MEYTISIVTLQTGKLYTMNTTNQPHNIKVGWPVFKRYALVPFKAANLWVKQYGPSSL